MRAQKECYSCLERLVDTASRWAAPEGELQERAREAGREVLRAEFSYTKIPTTIATLIQRIIKRITGNPDPFRPVKEREMDLAGELCARLPTEEMGAEQLFRLAVLGNALDFFRDLEVVQREFQEPVELVRDETELFLARLASTRRLLYLADNAGEVYFDLPLFRYLAARVLEAYYVVKALPTQNDLTLADVRERSLESAFGRVVSTGTDSPGLHLEEASEEMRELFRSADLILAKGMGNYETLSELSDPRVFHLLKAKCAPVARSWGVEVGSFIAAFGRS
ncbi:damage-control phosphatase ARMT1 family protein [Desulfothermobacter acidiphilus]|uniref:damage-control phosphatase ARMT1 family protein n=1 Tax=Desulfothermobacter acidiphilus TaxID=1938353 RepID=UPI003F8AC844